MTPLLQFSRVAIFFAIERIATVVISSFLDGSTILLYGHARIAINHNKDSQ